MSKGTIRQILLITDGCSNQGEDPVRVSEQIAKQGISVNVIGVLEDDQTEDPTGLTEVNEIAEAGNGVSRIVYAEDLSETVQMVTQQAITQTIQGYVSKELKDIFGKEVNEDELSPETKEEVHEIVEDLGETVDLQVLILIDTSASMQHKMSAVRESLNDLVISLRARMEAIISPSIIFRRVDKLRKGFFHGQTKEQKSQKYFRNLLQGELLQLEQR